MLVTLLNDGNPKYVERLREAVSGLENIKKLKHQPTYECREVGREMVDLLGQTKLCPSLVFVDPWGYAGLSHDLVSAAIKDWGCECIFFFNYNRVNMHLPQDLVASRMAEIFGHERAQSLREQVRGLPAEERERTIVEELCRSYKTLGQKRYVQRFRFFNADGNRTSHYIIHVTKGERGVELMKDVMAKVSTEQESGVASFDFNPQPKADDGQMCIWAPPSPLVKLKDSLLRHFSEKSVTVGDVFAQHEAAMISTRFTKRNYRDALNELEQEGRVVVDRNGDRGRRRGFPDDLKITFNGKEAFHG